MHLDVGIQQAFKKGLFFLLLISSLSVFPRSLERRLGIGLSHQLINNLPALSLKVQSTKTFAFGTLFSLKTNDRNGGYGFGLKVYRFIFREPYLTFYAAGLLALVNEKINHQSDTGYQLDATLGSEFHFQGLDSIGFSFEVGLSYNKLHDTTSFEVAGNNIVKAAVHFYL